MRYIKLSVKTGVMIMLTACQLQASAQSSSGITTAVPFVRVAPDAKSGGMANMGLATTADAYSAFYNSAKTVFAESKGEIGATYTPWLRKVTNDIFLASLSGFYKLDEEQALTGSFRFFNMGSMTITDYNGTKMSNYKPVEFAADLGYARKLSDKFGIGASFRYIYSKISTGSNNGVVYSAGNAFAADLSFAYNGLNKEGQGWTAGATIANLGTKIGYTNNNDNYFLPANLGVGAAYTSVINEENKLTLGIEVNKSLVPQPPADATEANMDNYYNKTSVFNSWGKSFGNNAFASGIGAEYNYDGLFFVRAGYNLETQNMGGRNYFTAGAGVNYEGLKFDFAYLAAGNTNPLANTLRFSIAYQPGYKKTKK